MKNSELLEPYLRKGKHSETLLINQLSQMRTELNQKTYKFGFGQSPFPIPAVIAEKLSEAACRKEYMSVQGEPELCKAITDFHGELENKKWNKSQIIIGSGSKILLFCVMAAFEKAEVLLPAPSWVSYEPQANLCGHQVTWLATSFENNWLLSAEQLELYCQTRTCSDTPLLLILNSPSNPTGQSYNTKQLKALAVIMKKYNIIVIADEIYSLLHFKDKYSTLDEFYPEGCIVSSGISKWCGAGGWRLGFVHIPEQLGKNFFQSVIGVASETYSCAPAPIQVAAIDAYSDLNRAKIFLARQKEWLLLINNYCVKTLSKSAIKVHSAQAGFYLFPDFSNYKKALAARNILTSEQLTAAIIDETGVALLPGSAFGLPASHLSARLAFVDFDGTQICNNRLQQPVFEKLKEGICLLCEWCNRLVSTQ